MREESFYIHPQYLTYDETLLFFQKRDLVLINTLKNFNDGAGFMREVFVGIDYAGKMLLVRCSEPKYFTTEVSSHTNEVCNRC